ncbi:MAG: hypothetical protein U0411_03545 [Thermodesulfovibrionales bacterium]
MKRTVIAAAVVALLVALAAGAMAFVPGGGMGGGPCAASGAAVSPEQEQKQADFLKDTLPLRQKMLQLRTDLAALRAQAKPDWEAIAVKRKEMVDVRTALQKKAYESGIAGCGQCGGMGMRGGMGRGMGTGMSGTGMM